jgi:hypothetical protein
LSNQTLFTCAVIVLALVAANAPFLSQRWAILGTRLAHKSLRLRLLELVGAYLMVGGVALFFEHHLGQIAVQTWEFYAVTASMFITLAFPGFVFRYLFKHRG